MSELTKAQQERAESCLFPTDVALQRLTNYGRPRLSKHSNGWHAGIEMFVTGKGIDFSVKTDFEQRSPTQAANHLLVLVEKALKDLNK